MSVDQTKRTSLWYHGGVASAGAACCTHPLDLLKDFLIKRSKTEVKRLNIKPNQKIATRKPVHLQTQQGAKVRGTQLAINIVRQQGFFALYNGISASVGRQLTYSLTRFAIYDTVKPMIVKDKNPTMAQKFMLASVGGFFGGIVGTPCDLINVRMQNDIKLERSLRRKHVFDGLYQVAAKEGISTLFNGVGMATTRAILITNGQLAFYDQIKEKLLSTSLFEDNIVTHFTASFLAGAIATAMTQPVDVMKTRLMNAKSGEYKNAWHCIVETGKQGPLSFFKGFVPAFIRLGPQTILIWVFKEQLRLKFGKDPIKFSN